VGEPPFTGPTAQSIVAKVLTEQPRPLLPKRHTIPRHVELAVLTALEKLPADRFASAAEFSTALINPGATTSGMPADRAARNALMPWWRHPAFVIAGVALLATAMGFAAGRAFAPAMGVTPVVTRFVVSTPSDHRLSGAPLGNVALSPDGTTLVYVGQNARGEQLYRRRIGELEVAAIAGTEGANNPLFSPDGRWISFSTGTSLRKIQASGGAVVPVPTGSLFPQGGVWLDDETLAVTALDGAVYAVDSEGKSRVIARPDSSVGEATLIVTDALDGGRKLIAIAAPGAGVTGRPYLIDVKSGKRQLMVDQIVSGIGYDRGFLTWASQDGTLLAATYDPDKSAVAGSPITLAQQVRTAVGGPPQFAISRTGSLVYVPQLPFDLMLVDRTGQVVRAADVQRRFHSPRFSPDGSRIAVDFTHQGSRDVWTLDLGDRTLTRLTFDNDGHDPVWEQGGARIGYASARAGVVGMFVRNADGSGQADSLYVGRTAQTIGAFVPGSPRAVSIITGKAGSFDLALTPLTGDRREQPFLATDFNEAFPAISPDGRWLAYVSDESGQFEVYVRPLLGAGAKVLVSQNGGSEPVWSRNGRELFYRGFSPQGTPLVAVSIQTNPALRVLGREELFDVSDYEGAAPHANYDVRSDGRFAMVYQGRLSQMVVIQNWPEEVRRRGAAAK
ncbi:MAG: hypothetical protein ABIV11_08355, partial [Gemmatimonadaceae bacterium]